MKGLNNLSLFLSALLMCFFYQASIFAEDCQESEILGKNDAKTQYHGYIWLIGGVGLGAAAPVLGTGVLTGMALFSNPQPTKIPENVDNNCYISSYTQKSKAKNIRNSLIGGIFGSVFTITLLLLL